MRVGLSSEEQASERASARARGGRRYITCLCGRIQCAHHCLSVSYDTEGYSCIPVEMSGVLVCLGITPHKNISRFVWWEKGSVFSSCASCSPTFWYHWCCVFAQLPRYSVWMHGRVVAGGRACACAHLVVGAGVGPSVGADVGPSVRIPFRPFPVQQNTCATMPLSSGAVILKHGSGRPWLGVTRASSLL